MGKSYTKSPMVRIEYGSMFNFLLENILFKAGVQLSQKNTCSPAPSNYREGRKGLYPGKTLFIH